MMRNLKVLGLALIAVFAMSALSASSASADELTSEVSPVTLSGVSEVSSPDTFTITAGNTSCKEVTYDIGTTSTPRTTITVLPTYPEKAKDGTSNCTSLGFPATIHVNGCHYVFHITGGTSTEGDVTLECPPNKDLTVTAVAGGTTKCTIHVPPQTLTGDPVKYLKVGTAKTQEIKVEVNAHGLKYTHTEGTGLGKCAPSGAGENGTYVGTGTLTALSDPATGTPEHVGLTLSNA